MSVLGRNGVGKTTLMRAILGLMDRVTGSISLDGTELNDKRTDQRALAGIGYVPQGRGILPKFTVRENLIMKPFLKAEVAPGLEKADAAAIEAYIRGTAITVHHPLGTCRMGPEQDSRSVVDEQLRVRGVEALRVIDASVMPTLTSGNINAPIVAIAEKASDLILGRNPLAPDSRFPAADPVTALS